MNPNLEICDFPKMWDVTSNVSLKRTPTWKSMFSKKCRMSFQNSPSNKCRYHFKTVPQMNFNLKTTFSQPCGISFQKFPSNKSRLGNPYFRNHVCKIANAKRLVPIKFHKDLFNSLQIMWGTKCLSAVYTRDQITVTTVNKIDTS